MNAAAKQQEALKKEPLYLIDGSGFIFRAFHALPPLTNPEGVPVNAVLGFTNMLTKLLADHSADPSLYTGSLVCRLLFWCR